MLSKIEKNQFLEDISSSFLNQFISCKFYCLFRNELEKQGLLTIHSQKIKQKVKKEK